MKQLSYRNLPKVSSLPTPSSSLEGVLVELTTDSHLYYCDGTQWIDVVGDTLETVVARGATATAPITITANSTSDALKVTQTGTGNALVVEDSTSPDNSPFVVTNSGYVVAGHTQTITAPDYNGAQIIHAVDIVSQVSNYRGVNIHNFSAVVGASHLGFTHSRSGVNGTHAILNSSDSIGGLVFSGSDGTNFLRGAQILAEVGTTPDTGAMPGRVKILTTRAGKVTIASVVRAANVVSVTLQDTGVSASLGLLVGDSVVIAGVTDTSFNGTFTLTSITNGISFTYAQAGTDASSTGGTCTLQGSTPTTRFIVDSRGRIAFGTGVSSNSQVSISGTTTLDSSVSGTESKGVYVKVTFAKGATIASSFQSYPNIYNSFAIPLLSHFTAENLSFSSGGSADAQYGFYAKSTLTTATNNYGFYSDIAEAAGRWNFYANGTAKNYFAGQTAIGTNAPSDSAKLQVDSTTQGFLPPRMTTTQRDAIATPASGLEIFNTTSNTKQYYNGSSWVNLTASGGSSGVVVTTITVDTGSTPSTSTIHTITDATVTSSSTVIANVSMTTTADNSLDDHQHAASSWKLACQSGTGQFDLYIDALADMYWGTFKINYIVY